MATVPVLTPSSLAEEQAVVRSSLDRLARRIRLAVWGRYASYAALAGSALSLAALLGWRLGWLVWPLVPVVASIYAAAFIASTVIAFRSKIPLLGVALLADDRQGLKQRLSSSLVLSDDPDSSSSPFFRLHMADAAAVAPSLDARKVFPLRPRWETFAAIGSVLATAIVIALVLRAMGVGLIDGAGPAIVAREGAKLADDARRIAHTADAQNLPQTKQYADKLAKLARQMQSRQMPQAEAVKKLSSLSAQVRQEQQQLAKQSPASATASKGAPNGTPAANMNPSYSPQGSAPESLSDTLRKMADQISSSPLTPSEQQRMAQALNNLANQAKSTGLPQTARHIAQASKALAQGNKAQAASELRQAAKMADLEQQQAMQQASKQAQNQAGQQAQNAQGTGSKNSQSASQSGQHGQGQKAQGQHGQGQKGQAGQGQHSAQGTQPGQQSQNAGQPKQGQPAQNGQPAQGNVQSGDQGSSSQQGNGSDAQGMQSIEQSLQQAEQRLSGQSNQSGQEGQQGVGDQENGQKPGSGSGNSSKPGNGQPRMGQGGYNAVGQQGGMGQAKGGAPSNVTQGDGKGSPTSPGKYAPSRISGTGYKTPQGNMGVWRGAPRQIDNYDPSHNNRYAKIYLPASSQTGPAVTRNDSNPPGAGPHSGQVSSVPYYKVYPQFKKSAEAALNKEDIPRAYENKVRQYFQSLAPQSAR